jgi:hypothetical protein
MLYGFPKGLRFLEFENFEPCVGENFYIESEPAALPIRLDRLVKLSHAPAFLPRAPFSVLWSTDSSVSLLRGTYALRNGAWGPHSIYVEPMFSSSTRWAYQSVFF